MSGQNDPFNFKSFVQNGDEKLLYMFHSFRNGPHRTAPRNAKDEEGVPEEALNPEIKRSSFSSWNSSRRSAQETQSAVIKAVTDVKKEHELMKSQNDAFDAITAGCAYWKK